MNLSSSVSPLLNIVSVFVFFLSLCHSAQTSDNIYETEQKVNLLSSDQLSQSNSNAISYSSDSDSEDSDQRHHYEPPLNLLGLNQDNWDTIGRYLTMRETLNFSMTSRDLYKFYHTSPLKLELLDTALQVYTQENQNPFFTDTVAHKLNILREITEQLEDMRSNYRQRNRPELVALMDNLFATAKADVDAFLQHAARVRFSPTFKLTDGHESLRYLAEIYTTELTYDYPVMDFFRSYFRETYYFTGGLAGAALAGLGSFLLYQYFKTHFKYPMDVHEVFLNQTEVPISRYLADSCFGCKYYGSYFHHELSYVNFPACGDGGNYDGGTSINGNISSWIENAIKTWKIDSTVWRQIAYRSINGSYSNPEKGKAFVSCFRNIDNKTLDCAFISMNPLVSYSYFSKASAECAANRTLQEHIGAWNTTWGTYNFTYHVFIAIPLFVYFLMPFLSWLL